MVKKLMVILLALILVLGGCGRISQSGRDQDDPEQEDDSGDSTLAKIVLEENPSTGYLWHYTLEPEGIVEVVDEDYNQDNPEAEGSGGTHVWKLKGIKEGTAEMVFVCYFQNEEENVSGDPVTYQIEVGPDGKPDVSLVKDSTDGKDSESSDADD